MDLSKWTGSLNELLKETDQKIKEVRLDPDLSRDAKMRRIIELQADFREQYARTRKDAEDNLEVDRKMALRRANPAEQVGDDVQGELLKEQRRARIHRELTAGWEGRGEGPTIQEYEAALTSGDELRIEAIEIYGPQAITNEDVRRQFSRRVEESRQARMTDDQRQALEELDTLQKAKLELGVVLNFKDSEATRLSDTPASQLADSSPAA